MQIWQKTWTTLRFGGAVVAIALIAAACGSDGEEPAAQVAAAAETAEETDDTTDGAESPTTDEEVEATSAEAGDEPADGESVDEEPTATEDSEAAIVIEASSDLAQPVGAGTWQAIKGADVLGCEGGALLDRGAEDQFAQRLTCEEGERVGSFVGRFAPSQASETFISSWEVILADGDYADMSGTGTWEATITGGSADILIEMDVEFGVVAAPLESFERISQQTEHDCFDGFVTEDGLVEFATVHGTMYRLDLVTQEETAHGAPPAPCANWLGDTELGRRVAVSFPGEPHALPDGEHKVYLGPFDGEWETEITYDEVTLFISRSLGSNRVVLAHPESGVIFLLDATTGEPVGGPLAGDFASRHSASVATSPDNQTFVIGGADVTTEGGQILLVDAPTGELLTRVELDVPASTVAFDVEGDAVIAGLATGEIVTIDVASGEVTSTVALDSRAIVQAVGVRPDGLIVASTERGAFLVDRVSGPTGAELAIKHSGAARIRPDGKINSLTNIQVVEVYEIEG